MIDTYTMMLWAKPKENSIDIQAKQIFDILTALSKVDYLKPRYQAVHRKKDAVEFDLTLENVSNLIINKKDKQFPNLGSLISFFTSLNDNDSAGISISVGVSNPKFINSIVINLNWDYKKLDIEKFDELVLLFKELINLFQPFYGCITSKSNSDMFDEYYNDTSNTPSSILDVNYLGKDTIKNLRISDKKLKEIYEYEIIDDGYYIRLQKEPIDISNIKHIELQKKINQLLGV